ncbi:MAG TPA: LPS assembly protein LptD [Candidatus Acidoferrales bacterium]|nr:LPS assembly protein LptD [Candidatus Acidoferrales bacterium]
MGLARRAEFVPLALVLALALARPAARASAQSKPATGSAELELEADQQRKVGPMFYADGHVDARYGSMRLRADHAEYDEKTRLLRVRGGVRFDYRNQTIRASSGWYDLASGRAGFENVTGTIRAVHRANPLVLVSPNPLSFQAESIERPDPETYVVHHGWLTVCDPRHPIWKFYAAKTTIKLDRKAVMRGADFRLFSIPVLYLPYASLPASQEMRQSGFLIPDVGESSLKGFVLGDSYYWTPASWLDMTFGGQYYSRRGWSEIASLRARPSENLNVEADYFGVSDRGIPGPGGTTIRQGGYESHQQLDALLGDGWRLAAELNQLSSLQFRLAFAETLSQAVNPEVESSAFLTNNFSGYSLNFAVLNYENFLSLSPEETTVLRRAPEALVSSVDRPLFRRLPLYFGFGMFADAVDRSDTASPQADTGPAVQRAEVAPSLTLPLRWGPWLGITPTFVVRATRYGAQQAPGGAILNSSLDRITEELTVDVRPPAFAREWGKPASRWKHAIETDVVYRNVQGVDDFARIIRFDEDDTLTDTNDLEFSVTQRLFHRSGDKPASELVSWQLTQKYYFDPTFGGALVPGQRNVLQALDSLTPFAFADRTRRFSPVISDLRIAPGSRWDVQLRQDVDPVLGRVTATGALVKIRPYRDTFLTLAHFSVNTNPVLQPHSNQIRALAGLGDINRPGWNTSFGFSYDAHQHLFQNQLAQIGYNGSCCGITLEYRRLALGPFRIENRFGVALQIANIGAFGKIRRQEKIF